MWSSAPGPSSRAPRCAGARRPAAAVESQMRPSLTSNENRDHPWVRWRPAGVCVSPQDNQPREDQIKHGPELAGVDTVGRTYGASQFGRMTTYINLCMAIIPCYPGGKLQYSNLYPG